MLSALIGTERVGCSGVAALQLEYRVDPIGPHGMVDRGPSKDGAVEILGGGLVGGAELDPAKRSGEMLVDVGHGEVSLHQGGRAGCHREMKQEALTAEIAEFLESGLSREPLSFSEQAYDAACGKENFPGHRQGSGYGLQARIVTPTAKLVSTLHSRNDQS